MTSATHETSGGAGDWRVEALKFPCPYCGAQPPESCHGEPGELAVFPGPGHRTIKMHAPRWRQVPSYSAHLHGD